MTLRAVSRVFGLGNRFSWDETVVVDLDTEQAAQAEESDLRTAHDMTDVQGTLD